MSYQSQPPTPDPQEVQQSKQVLDYSPVFERVPEPAVPSFVNLAEAQTAASGAVVTPLSVHLLETVAIWRDATVVSTWLRQSVSAFEAALAPLTIPVSSNFLTPQQARMLQQSVGQQVAFADYQQALKNPTQPESGLVRQLWDRYHFGMGGRLDAQLYAPLYGLTQRIFPITQSLVRVLLDLTDTGILGSVTSSSPQAQLERFAAQLQNQTATFDSKRMNYYKALRQTVATQVSDHYNAALSITSGVAASQWQPEDAYQTALSLGTVTTTAGSDGDPRLQIERIIAALRGLETFFIVENDASWLVLSGVTSELDGFFEGLIYRSLSQLSASLTQLQSLLGWPISEFLSATNQAFRKRKKPVGLDRLENAMLDLMEANVGKFEQHLLGMYRLTSHMHDLINKQVAHSQRNDEHRQTIRLINQMIQILQEAENQDWIAIASQVSDTIKNRNGKQAQVPSHPTLAIQVPPQNSDIMTLASYVQQPTLSTSGSSGDVVQRLLSDIQTATQGG